MVTLAPQHLSLQAVPLFQFVVQVSVILYMTSVFFCFCFFFIFTIFSSSLLLLVRREGCASFVMVIVAFPGYLNL